MRLVGILSVSEEFVAVTIAEVKKARFVVKRPQFDFQLFPLFAT
jgi:hypothetical protein